MPDELESRYDELVVQTEDVDITRRLAELKINRAKHGPRIYPGSQAASSYEPQDAPTPLVSRIPAPKAPQVLGLGGHLQQSIPIIPQERDLSQDAVDSTNDGTFLTFQAATPPPADCVYNVVDQGVSSPDFFRVSMYNVPATSKLRERTQLPLALYLRPLALPIVPTANFEPTYLTQGDSDHTELPPRCNRCRAYVNPSVRFTSGGANFVCNLCNYTNITPQEYFSPTMPDGRRLDWESRPELAYGTYDFIVDETYGKKKGGFKHVFLCQSYTNSVDVDLLSIFSVSLKSALQFMNHGDEIAIILFDKYARGLRLKQNTKKDVSTIEMLTFLPDMGCLPPDVFIKIDDNSIPEITHLIESIPTLVTEYDIQSCKECCFGDLVECVLDSAPFKADGGRITATLSTIPTGNYAVAPGDPALFDLTGDGNDPRCAEISEPYKKLASQVVNAGSALDIFVVANRGPICLSNLSFLAMKTGGRVEYFPRFVEEKDTRAVITAFLAVCSERLCARQADVRIRCSLGLSVDSIHSTGTCDSAKSTKAIGGDGDSKLSFFDSQSTLTYILKYDSDLNPALDVHFQAAMLYTDNSGVRKVRVYNLMAGVSVRMKPVLKFVDSDVILATICRQALAEAVQAIWCGSNGENSKQSQRYKQIRAAILHKVEDIFGAARLFAGQGLPNSQLLMPTSLRQLPMLALALTKSAALGSRSFSADFKAFNAYELLTSTPNQLTLSLYPRIYDIGEKTMLRATYNALTTGSGACLVYTGSIFMIYLTSNVDPQIIVDLWGVESLQEVPPFADEIPTFDNETNNWVQRLMSELPLRVGRSWCPLQIVRQELDGAEYVLRSMMSEDPLETCPSYDRYIQRLHDRAKNYKETESWF